ncbi:MAG TPA: glycogen synthase GlgA [Candidatus Hydrogenedentes bacterium]|nr:glycogen synthase GlgA [Candidatus Hydrogenedentota bacterium]
MAEPLKILFVTSEAAPLVKTGGLGDVSSALPSALRALGHDCRVVMPGYGTIPKSSWGEQVATCTAWLDGPVYGAVRRSIMPDSNVPLYLIEHNDYYNREHPYGVGGQEYPDNVQRFCFFCLATLDGIRNAGWVPDIVHCHDWHTAPIPAYIKTRCIDHPVWSNKPSLFTIHNMAYQGRYPSTLMPKTGLGWELFSPKYLEFYGDINLMKAGIIFASKINTVSVTYAKEIQTEIAGHGLEGVLRTRAQDLTGIPNGVDTAIWDPANDRRIPASFSASDLSGKRLCKSALQRRVGLPVGDAPVFSMVTRLVWDKGIDLLLSCLDDLLRRNVQLVILGSGDPVFEDALRTVQARHAKKMHVHIGYDEDLAHQIYAGSDFYLMPSRTEPCGLSQMYAMRYGALPVVHRTGGLADTVNDASPTNIEHGTATGLVFASWSERAFQNMIARALKLFADENKFQDVQKMAMSQDFSWQRSANAYVDLFREAIAKP